MKTFYQLCVLMGLVMNTHSGAIPARIGKEENALELKVLGNRDGAVPVGTSYEVAPGVYKWPTNQLTYRIENYTPDLSQAKVDDSIERAFQVWADVTPLRFTRIYSGEADIMISFVAGDHGDNSPFYGTDDYVAHAFNPSPGLGGDIHFNDQETFSYSSSYGYNLFRVAAHEIGHALGLQHADDPGALMYKFYSFRKVQKFILPQNDFDAIQSLYGPNPDKPADPENPEPTRPVTPDACDANLVMDAVTMLRGEMIFFKKGLFWRIQPFSKPTEQHLINSFWPKAPENIDAAYENPSDDLVYLFKGQKVWALYGYDVAEGYPKTLKGIGLPAKVKKITAALYDHDSGKALFFAGKKYYSYDAIKKKLNKGYPKPVEALFPGMTSEVTAAFQYRGFTYLYSGTHMFEFDTGARKLMRVLKSNYFLQC
ncbi:collagenase 3-like [Salminus brasiliensis]|uniref:collagenase 3-like n=1 Tax=Salminus brasiliensis TaxID=930266 RepID=UPI003B83107B